MHAIAGIIYPEGFPLTFAVNSALEVLSSRCPEEAHTYGHKNVELGARGAPLSFNDRHTACVILDGTIENRQELVAELRKMGHKADMHSSIAQLIYLAHEVWGGQFAAHLQGVFALALYDLPKRQLVLARDRIGVRPLYWAYLNQYFLFASELKALLATGLVPQNPCEEAISAYLHLGFIPQDLAPIREVNKLLPAHTLRFDLRGNLHIQSYWSYSTYFLQSGGEASEVAAVLDRSLSQSIRSHLPREGSVGYLASSSIASAAVGSYLVKATHPERTVALTTQFSAEHVEELTTAQTIAMRLGVSQHSCEISPAYLLQHLINTTWRLDEPVGEPLVLCLWRTLHLSQGLVSALFTDVGANKVLTNTLSEQYTLRHWSMESRGRGFSGPSWLTRLFIKICQPWLPSLSFRLMRKRHTAPWLEHFAKRWELFSPKTLSAMAPSLASAFALNLFLHRFYGLHSLGEGPNAQLYLDAKTVLPDRDLLVYDRLAATFEMTLHSPFLEPSLLEQLAGIPEQFKRPRGADLGPLQQLLPPFQDVPFRTPLSKQQKPLSSWLYDVGLARTFEYVKTGALVESGWISARWIRQALSPRHTPPLSFKQLWSLLTLEVWYRLYIINPVTPHPPKTALVDFLRHG